MDVLLNELGDDLLRHIYSFIPTLSQAMQPILLHQCVDDVKSFRVEGRLCDDGLRYFRMEATVSVFRDCFLCLSGIHECACPEEECNCDGSKWECMCCHVDERAHVTVAVGTFEQVTALEQLDPQSLYNEPRAIPRAFQVPFYGPALWWVLTYSETGDILQ